MLRRQSEMRTGQGAQEDHSEDQWLDESYIHCRSSDTSATWLLTRTRYTSSLIIFSSLLYFSTEQHVSSMDKIIIFNLRNMRQIDETNRQ